KKNGTDRHDSLPRFAACLRRARSPRLPEARGKTALDDLDDSKRAGVPERAPARFIMNECQALLGRIRVDLLEVGFDNLPVARRHVARQIEQGLGALAFGQFAPLLSQFLDPLRIHLAGANRIAATAVVLRIARLQ